MSSSHWVNELEVSAPRHAALSPLLSSSLSSSLICCALQVLTAIRAIPVPTLDELPGFAMRRRCMEELSKDQFSKVMHDHQQRDCAFELLKDPAVVNDFLLYPQDYRHLFLEDIVLKALNLK